MHTVITVSIKPLCNKLFDKESVIQSIINNRKADNVILGYTFNLLSHFQKYAKFYKHIDCHYRLNKKELDKQTREKTREQYARDIYELLFESPVSLVCVNCIYVSESGFFGSMPSFVRSDNEEYRKSVELALCNEIIHHPSADYYPNGERLVKWNDDSLLKLILIANALMDKDMFHTEPEYPDFVPLAIQV